MNFLLSCVVILICDSIPGYRGASINGLANTSHYIEVPVQDAIIPGASDKISSSESRAEFNYKYITQNGQEFTTPGSGRLEIAATLAISDTAFTVGTKIVHYMTRNMPTSVYSTLSGQASVGLFTYPDKTTIFPEYEHLADRPECEGTCAGACSDTCTSDGRKWDSLAGLGGIRGTCLDDNFMCTPQDPYYSQYSVLVHEFGHTIHQYGLSSTYYNQIYAAYVNARNQEIWDVSSYAMVNELEYFAEGTGVFFNTNNHPTSSGGMNGCGHAGFCTSETEARNWLQSQDPQLFDALSYTYTNYQPTLPGGLAICVTP